MQETQKIINSWVANPRKQVIFSHSTLGDLCRGPLIAQPKRRMMPSPQSVTKLPSTAAAWRLRNNMFPSISQRLEKSRTPVHLLALDPVLIDYLADTRVYNLKVFKFKGVWEAPRA